VSGRAGGYAQRVQYDGVAGDGAGKTLQVEVKTAAGTFAQNDVVTGSVDLKGSFSGTSTKLVIWSLNAAGAYAGDSGYGTAITLTGSFVRYFFSLALASATTSAVLFGVWSTGHKTGTSLDITIDDVLIEKSAVLTPYFDGTYPDCAWTGPANASTSTRGASVLQYTTGIPANLNAAGTWACRWTPLFASTTSTEYEVLSTNLKDTVYANWIGYLISKYSGKMAYDDTTTFAAGSSHSVVASWSAGAASSGSFDGSAMKNNGASGAATAAITTLAIGMYQSGGYQADAYIGSVAVPPTRITVAEEATLSAMLTAGARGIDLFSFFRDRGYTGTLILPLQSDSVGYLVVG
jgi:hypothetical protein